MSAAEKYYGDLALDQKAEQWVISNVPPHVALRLKHIFPKIDKASAGPFNLSAANDVSADIEWFTMRYPLRVSDKEKRILRKRAKNFRTFTAELGHIATPEYKGTEREGLFPGQALRWYQKNALDFVQKVRQMLVIDDVGLGKTYEGLGISLLPDSGKLVCVVSPHLAQQWVKKAKKFINRTVYAPQGNTPYTLPDAQIYVFKYTQISPWVDHLTKGWIGSIAFDEVQHLRTGDNSKKGRAARQICQEVTSRNGYVVGLSASLIYNYGAESFVIADIIRPGCLGTREEFLREWCHGDPKGKVKDPDALGAYLREINMVLRRTKKDVGQQSKALKPELFWVPPDVGQLREQEELAASLAQTAIHGGFLESGQASRLLDMKLRQMTGMAKAISGAGIAKIFLDNKIPLLIYAWHREVYRVLAAELAEYQPAFYTGSETPKQKNQSIERFLAGDTDALIMSLRSGEGVDELHHRCSNVLWIELDFSPAVLLQNLGRVDRDEPENPVYSHYVVTNYGSDPAMLDILGLKDQQAFGIQNPGESREIRQVDTERFKVLAKKFLDTKGVDAEMDIELVTKPEDVIDKIQYL